MTPALICASVEVALNRTLQLEPEILDDLQGLKGRLLLVHVEVLEWDFFIEVIERGVRVLANLSARADVRLSGTPIALSRAGLHYARQQPGLPSGLVVEGDTELLTRFSQLLVRANVNPEELVAKFLGDGPAQRLVGGLKTLFGWAGNTGISLLSNTSEYLREESYDLAKKPDADAWADAIDLLRDDSERLEARIKRLEKARS